MTSSSPSPGWSTQGLRQLRMMSQRGQHEPLQARHLHGYMLTAEMEDVWWGSGRGWKVVTVTAAKKRRGNGELLFMLPSSPIHRSMMGMFWWKRNSVPEYNLTVLDVIRFNNKWFDLSLILIDFLLSIRSNVQILSLRHMIKLCLTFQHTLKKNRMRRSGHYDLYLGTLRHADEISFLVKTDFKPMWWSYWLTNWQMNWLLICERTPGRLWGSQLRWSLSLGQAARPGFTLPLRMSPQHISSAFLPFITTPWQANSSEQEKEANPLYLRQW